MSKSVNSTSGLYSGGAVVFDQSPTINLYRTLMAQKSARETAFDNYIKDTSRNIINDTSKMRSQDIDGLMKRLELWSTQASGNADVLSNPTNYKNGTSLYKGFNDGLSDILGYVRRSVEDKDKEATFIKASSEARKKGWTPTQQDLEIYNAFNKPIDDPARKVLGYKFDPVQNVDQKTEEEPDLQSISLYTPKLDMGKYINSLIGKDKPSKLPTGNYTSTKDPLTVNAEYETKYSDDKLKNMGKQAIIDASTTGSAQQEFANDLVTNPSFSMIKDDLDAVYKKVMGSEAKTPQDYFSAYMMKILGGSQMTTERMPLKDLQMEKNSSLIMSRKGVGGGSGSSNQPFELPYDYKDGDNLSKYFQGINITNTEGIKSGTLTGTPIFYDKDNDTFTFTEFSPNHEQGFKRTIPANQLLEEIKTINTKQNINQFNNILNALRSGNDNDNRKPKKSVLQSSGGKFKGNKSDAQDDDILRNGIKIKGKSGVNIIIPPKKSNP